MTKGKHAIASALRREREAQSLSEELATQIKDLKSQLAASRASQNTHEANVSELKRVRSQLKDGTSDEVNRLKLSIIDLKSTVKSLNEKDSHRQKVWSKAVENMIYHFTEVHKLHKVEALEVLVELLGHEAATIIDHDHQRRMGSRWTKAMQARAGNR